MLLPAGSVWHFCGVMGRTGVGFRCFTGRYQLWLLVSLIPHLLSPPRIRKFHVWLRETSIFAWYFASFPGLGGLARLVLVELGQCALQCRSRYR